VKWRKCHGLICLKLTKQTTDFPWQFNKINFSISHTRKFLIKNFDTTNNKSIKYIKLHAKKIIRKTQYLVESQVLSSLNFNIKYIKLHAKKIIRKTQYLVESQVLSSLNFNIKYIKLHAKKRIRKTQYLVESQVLSSLNFNIKYIKLHAKKIIRKTQYLVESQVYLASTSISNISNYMERK